MVSLVLSSLAFACAAQAPVGQIPPNRFPEFLRGLGYEVSVVNKGGILQITDGDLRFMANLGVLKGAGDPQGYVVFVELSGGYRVDHAIPKAAAQEWSQKSAYGRGNVDSYLDGTVFATWRVGIANVDEGSIRQDISEYVRKLKLVQSVFLRGMNPKLASESETYDNVRPDSNMVVHGLETRDLAYLVRQWHIDFQGSFGLTIGGGIGTIPQFVTVNKASFYLAVPDRVVLSQHNAGIEFAVCGAPASPAAMKNITWASVEPGAGGAYSIRKEVDLAQGMSLGQLRSRVGDFANQVAALHLDLDWIGHRSKKKG